ncbi:hypothetical protein PN498_03095 [Oscillatoria sp. CS-180]|uniref:hypothetical protein n=1 Tax=Oscillatoria sp. CS-180 TaxID=3021720 RepID=UPI00232C1F92|nr:hypothetical protein [Oscillatoria sp. CS-180]MDB9524962.1 hypothetical protein [Oscillatoria sp. CS-180]
MKGLVGLVGALGWLLMTPLVAEAAKLSLTGRVELATVESPVEDAQITVTFHGHEMGIHEYTIERRVRVQTDDLGYFTAEVKVPSDRYFWTHTTVEIAETEMSKAAISRSTCHIDDIGGGRCDKNFQVSPLTTQPVE